MKEDKENMLDVVYYPPEKSSNKRKRPNTSGTKARRNKKKRVSRGEYFEKRTTPYRGVCWNRSTQKWRGRVAHLGKEWYLGLFHSDKEAGMVANWKCQKLGIELYNPDLPVKEPKSKDKSSVYRGVFWDTTTGKWKGQLYHKKKKFYLGLFVKQIEAAQAVNWQCREFGVNIANPSLPCKRPPPKKKYEKKKNKKNGANWKKAATSVGSNAAKRPATAEQNSCPKRRKISLVKEQTSQPLQQFGPKRPFRTPKRKRQKFNPGVTGKEAHQAAEVEDPLLGMRHHTPAGPNIDALIPIEVNTIKSAFQFGPEIYPMLDNHTYISLLPPRFVGSAGYANYIPPQNPPHPKSLYQPEAAEPIRLADFQATSLLDAEYTPKWVPNKSIKFPDGEEIVFSESSNKKMISCPHSTTRLGDLKSLLEGNGMLLDEQKATAADVASIVKILYFLGVDKNVWLDLDVYIRCRCKVADFCSEWLEILLKEPGLALPV